MENINDQILNPWVSIWTKPRATIQQIVDTDPENSITLLVCMGGFAGVLARATGRGLGDTMELPAIFILAAVLGPFAGVISLYIGSALISWTGKWIGGIASSQNIRAAMAWSSVPIILSLVLWIPELILFGEELFTTETPIIDASLSLTITIMIFWMIELIIGIWAIVIYLKCLGQVQGFSAWKALANAFLSGLVALIPLVIIVLLLV